MGEKLGSDLLEIFMSKIVFKCLTAQKNSSVIAHVDSMNQAESTIE